MKDNIIEESTNLRRENPCLTADKTDQVVSMVSTASKSGRLWNLTIWIALKETTEFVIQNYDVMKELAFQKTNKISKRLKKIPLEIKTGKTDCCIISNFLYGT